MHWAAYGGHVGALEALAAVGVSVNMRAAEDASTPLHLAAENGNAAAVRWLVECGVSVLSKRRDGARALKLAGEAGHRELQAYVRRRGKAVCIRVICICMCVVTPSNGRHCYARMIYCISCIYPK